MKAARNGRYKTMISDSDYSELEKIRIFRMVFRF